MSLWNYERASNGTDASGGETAFARRLRSQPIIQHRQTQTPAVCSAVFSEKMNTGFPKKSYPQAVDKSVDNFWVGTGLTPCPLRRRRRLLGQRRPVRSLARPEFP